MDLNVAIEAALRNALVSHPSNLRLQTDNVGALLHFVAQVLCLACNSGTDAAASPRNLEHRSVIIHGSFARVLEIVGAALGVSDQDGTFRILATAHGTVALVLRAGEERHGRGAG